MPYLATRPAITLTSEILHRPRFNPINKDESVISSRFLMSIHNEQNIKLEIIANNFCGSINRIAFFEYYCPNTTRDLAVFPKFMADPGDYSTVKGKCIKNASVLGGHGNPHIICTHFGEIKPDAASSKCQCNNGFRYNGRECQGKVNKI